MGGCQSKSVSASVQQQYSNQRRPSHAAITAGSNNSKKKGSNHKTQVTTRSRVDSWAPASAVSNANAAATTDTSTTAATATTASSSAVEVTHQPRPPAELQWKFLWDTYSPHLVEPIDVPSVLDTLLNRTINRLSTVQLTLLQRKVRHVLHHGVSSTAGTPPTPSHTPSSKTSIAKVMNWGSSHHHQVDAIHEEAKMAAHKYHVLTPAVWQSVLPILQNSNDEDAVVWMNNLTHLLGHLSGSAQDWDRATTAAHVSTQAAAGLDLDVNHKNNHERPMPIPSRIVPDWTQEPATMAPPVTLVGLAAFIAMAHAGTRAQKLQILFYTAMPDLGDFLATHAGGGVPVWLLETSDTIVSLASIVHYHYYGTAFLPGPHTLERHCISQSRDPAQTSCAVLWKLLNRSNSTTTANSKKEAEEEEGESSHAAEEDSEAATEEVSLLSPVTEAVFGTRDVSNTHNIDTSALPSSEDDLWTLQEFRAWTDQYMSDEQLEALLQCTFTVGILPTQALEKELVQTAWERWLQQQQPPAEAKESNTNMVDAISHSVQKALGAMVGHTTTPAPPASAEHSSSKSLVWGGLGGLDGTGGLGHGILYCVDRKWWDAWVAYTGWSWLGERPNKRSTLQRPGPLSNEELLDTEVYIRGALGSYECMKNGLKRNIDYVLVPPQVWNILYELYGGGPPLPRMVRPPDRKFSFDNRLSGDPSDHAWEGNPEEEDLDAFMQELGLDTVGRIPRLPDYIAVTTHPWIIHCQLCEPQQPYRRGDVGAPSIRVMAAPDQPLWRMLAEIVSRFPLDAFKAFDADQKGMARLWKRIDMTGQKGPVSRYGPWNLLCKSRHLTLPMLSDDSDPEEYSKYVEDWQTYTDNATVESLLTDHDHLMFEFATCNKQGDLVWPREAAAKAGRVRRLEEEELEFRRMLLGVDKNGSLLLKPPDIVGMEVDALDSSGRWYTVRIKAVEIVDDDTTEEEEEDGDPPAVERRTSKKIKVDFSDHGGHSDWIDVESDRLGPAGRFTNEAEQQEPQAPQSPGRANGVSNGESKNKGPIVIVKKNSNGDAQESTKICTLPGYGSCGLTNLGNTCYMNSALQCIGYLPILRAYLLSSQFKATGDLNKDNPLGTGGKLLEEAVDLLRVMWSAKYGEKSATRFKAQLGRINPMFSGADQQDAQEFLSYILDALHEDCNRIQKKPYVEALEDDWVKQASLPHVGEESWRRFLRRDRSIMADVAFLQVLNTVTCPVCDFSSRNFEPMNLLSIPIPTVADVIFQCTVVRRATAFNCPWLLDYPRKGSKRHSRYSQENTNGIHGPPSKMFAAEQYVISMSRLADSSDLRVQIEKLCGIPSSNLRLCRADEIQTNESQDDSDTFCNFTKLAPLNDKEGPCSQLAKRRLPNDSSPAEPTVIVAFESTLARRPVESRSEEETDIDMDTSDSDDPGVQQHLLEHYGDSDECRMYDTKPTAIAKAVSSSLWPRNANDFRIGLRVDAKDHRGNWFPGSVVDIVDEVVFGADSDTGEEVKIQTKKALVHFDNFSPKWDETYSMEHFVEGKVRPLYSHAAPKAKATDFLLLSRLTDGETSEHVYFGHPLYVQCHNDWSNARAGAQIIAQAARFMQYRADAPASDDSDDRESFIQRLYDKACRNMSDLMDVLIEADKEYVQGALGLSQTNNGKKGKIRHRNPSFDSAEISGALAARIAELMPRLPFEIRVCTSDPTSAERTQTRVEEESFPFLLTKTIGNYINARNCVVLHWRSPPKDRNGSTSVRTPVMYTNPRVEIHRESASLLRNPLVKKKEHGKQSHPGSAGIDLGVCLTEFCKAQKLSLDDNWRCPRCKDFREGKQAMNLWRLPDLLTFHIKRFNMSAKWREKITTKVNFPLNGLDMREWCHEESPAAAGEDSNESYVYDLIGVMNHYGSMTGGHYVATCKATACGRDGREEVAYAFHGEGVAVPESEESDTPSGWRPLGRQKSDPNPSKMAAAMASRAVSKSTEPMWLQFDDEIVEPIPPEHIVSEMAYVLFYRRRQISPSNVARYSTLE